MLKAAGPERRPEPLRDLKPKLPEELAELVHRVLEKYPERRFRNGAELAADLTRIQQKLRSTQTLIDEQERVAVLRRLRFFHVARRDPRGDARGRVAGLPGWRARAAPG